MIIADEWLLQIGLQGHAGRSIAQLCLRTQTRVYRRTGHILCMNDEKVRSEILRACRHMVVPHVVVRCMRCGVHAWLADWHACVQKQTPENEYALTVIKHSLKQFGVDFENECEGDDVARGMSALLGPRGGEPQW